MKFLLSMSFISLMSAFFNLFCQNTSTDYFSSGIFSDNFKTLTTDLFNSGLKIESGGVIGGWISHLLTPLFGIFFTGVIILAVVLAVVVLTTGITLSDIKIRKRPDYDEKNVSAENKALKKDIKEMRKELDSLKKRNFTIPETDESENNPKTIISEHMKNSENTIYENPCDKEEKKSIFGKKKNRDNYDRDEELRKNKEDFDDILLTFKAKSEVNVLPSYAHGAKPVEIQSRVNASSAEEQQRQIKQPEIEVEKETSCDSPEKTETVIESKPESPKPVNEENTLKTLNTDKALSAEEQFEQAAIRELETVKRQAEETEKMLRAAEAEEPNPRKNVYTFPPISLLSYTAETNADIYREELKQNATKLTDALASFNVQATVVDAKRGPTVTRYELTPDAGVKISKFTGLSDDIALHLAAQSVRIEAPIPGKAAIGVEIPNKTRSTVYLKEIVASDEFKENTSKISVALGKDISGQSTVIDLARMPHLLIAGATGSGKSICINSILISLLYKSTPDEVKLLLVDPKVVELSVYNGIPHLLIPVVTNPEKAAGALQWAVGEMLNRYKLFADKGVRDFTGYNKSLSENEKKLPQIVIVIDELADLMMAAPNEVEDAICRLAQMARAAGMHLVIATQRPSSDVITGIIKANIPSRIAFAVSSAIDSRIILDGGGAEKLVGKGDMLYSPLGASKPQRVQGSFVSDKEVEHVVAFIKENYVSEYDNSIMEKIEQNVNLQKNSKKAGLSSTSGEDDGPEDEKLNEAIRCVVENGQASVSMLQRKIGLGFSRAGKLIDEMEKRGIVGPYQGSKPRDVLITKAQWQEICARRDDTQ